MSLLVKYQVLRGASAMAFAGVMTAASLGVVAAVNREPPHPEPSPPRPHEPIELAVVSRPPPPVPEVIPEMQALDKVTEVSLAPRQAAATLPEFEALASDAHPGAFGLRVGAGGLGRLGVSNAPSGSLMADRSAKPSFRPAPTYPAAARRKGIEGFVSLRLEVDPEGMVAKVEVLESEPPGVFERVARRTARRYRFAPAVKDGKKVASTLEQRLVFELR